MQPNLKDADSAAAQRRRRALTAASPRRPAAARRGALFAFWRDVAARYESSIENLALEEEAPGRFVRRARLGHRPRGEGEALGYEIVQTTELRRGRVARQVNTLAG